MTDVAGALARILTGQVTYSGAAAAPGTRNLGGGGHVQPDPDTGRQLWLQLVQDMATLSRSVARVAAASASSASVGTGSKVFTASDNRRLPAGIAAWAIADADPSALLFGRVAAVDDATGDHTLDVEVTAGEGTFDAWTLVPAGERGASIAWRGAWDAGTAYAQLDAVSYRGGAWIASAPTAAGDEPGVAAAWSRLTGDGLTWRGTWASGTAYARNDAVHHAGAAWLATADTAAGEEPGVAAAWSRLAAPGGISGGIVETSLGYARLDHGSADGGTITFDVAARSKHRLQVAGDLTLALANWPAAGTYGEVEIELVDGGGATLTWPTVHWVVGDGSTSTAFADMGVTLQAAGTNHVFLWSTDGGATVHGVVR